MRRSGTCSAPRGDAGGAEPPEAVPSLAIRAAPSTVTEADDAFAAIGRVSGPARRPSEGGCWPRCAARATEEERSFLVQLLAGELRQGALEGVMVEAVAQAAGVRPRRSGAR